MSDPPFLPVPAPGHLLGSSRQYRSTSGSPTRQRTTDDLLSQLSPPTALHALRHPSGTLKRCMDSATPSEQSFAVRAAKASKNIQDWLEELSEWPWPSDTPSAGFEAPPGEKQQLSPGHRTSTAGQASAGSAWMGSLLADDVVRYGQRVDAIRNEMDDMDVEGIKTHVLHHHILPLSRPGTPMSDSLRCPTPSAANFNKMDDLTAIITAVVLHALPNLSKLVRLMNSWTARLLVLKRVPTMLSSLVDAEVAIDAGWTAIHAIAKDGLPSKVEGETLLDGQPTLTLGDFQMMKVVIEKKISKAAHIVDYMLNSLDGREETIPDDWIDRMDKVEEEYSQWVAACERKIRESGWKRMIREKSKLQEPTEESVKSEMPETGNLSNGHAALSGLDMAHRDLDNKHPVAQNHSGADEVLGPTDHGIPDVVIHEESAEDDPSSVKRPSSPYQEAETLQSADGKLVESYGKTHHDAKAKITDFDGFDGVGATNGHDVVATSTDEPTAQSVSEDNSPENDHSNAPRPASPIEQSKPKLENQEDSSLDKEQPQPDEGDDRFSEAHSISSRGSVASLASLSPMPALQDEPKQESEFTNDPRVIPGDASGLDLPSDLPSDFPENPDTPELPRMREVDVDADPTLGEDSSPPSSPPTYRNSLRSSVTFNDMPTVTELPDDESPPQTPMDSSFLDDPEIPQDIGSPRRMSVSSEDDQLQQQISEILESIPAKIHLSSQPAPINHLNPPEFQPPRPPRSKQVETVRSHSSMSSRAGTPSFLLAPAYARGSRPRQQRGNPEIKLYHLSRSTGEAPIKLFIRLVGENGERVMVRVGGGWADLGEYLKEYASHHGRRSKGGSDSKIEVRDLPALSTGKFGSSPPSRPASALDSPMTPLNVRKTRKSVGEESGPRNPKTPLATASKSSDTPSSGTSTRSRSSSRLSWTEEDSSLGMSGPKAKNIEMSEESRAWVQSVKEKVRLASGERKASDSSTLEGKFGEIGKVGGTKRLFRKADKG